MAQTSLTLVHDASFQLYVSLLFLSDLFLLPTLKLSPHSCCNRSVSHRKSRNSLDSPRPHLLYLAVFSSVCRSVSPVSLSSKLWTDGNQLFLQTKLLGGQISESHVKLLMKHLPLPPLLSPMRRHSGKCWEKTGISEDPLCTRMHHSVTANTQQVQTRLSIQCRQCLL